MRCILAETICQAHLLTASVLILLPGITRATEPKEQQPETVQKDSHAMPVGIHPEQSRQTQSSFHSEDRGGPAISGRHIPESQAADECRLRWDPELTRTPERKHP